MILASEDPLGEVVLRKLISEVRPELMIRASLGNRGKGYLRSRARELNQTARSIPVFLLVDSDTRVPCPADLIVDWLGGQPNKNLAFRVAVMEVESWVLADRGNCSRFLGVPVNRIPVNTDLIDDPKQFLVNLARRSRKRDIREDVVPAAGALVGVGPAYNVRLAEFVSASWDLTAATSVSTSLRRAVNCLNGTFART